jgi:hypothetical protein
MIVVQLSLVCDEITQLRFFLHDTCLREMRCTPRNKLQVGRHQQYRLTLRALFVIFSQSAKINANTISDTTYATYDP